MGSCTEMIDLLHLILEEEEEIQLTAGKEEMVGRVMRSLQEEIGGFTANCCVQSDSAFCMTSSSSRVSESDRYGVGFGRQCRCHEDAAVDDQLGYLLGASDEELGIPASPWCRENRLMIMDYNDGSADLSGSGDLQGLAMNESSFCMAGWVDWEMGAECYEECIRHFVGDESSKEAAFAADSEQGMLPCSSAVGKS